LKKKEMSKTTRITTGLSESELMQKIKETRGFWRVQKWLIIYNAVYYPRKAEEIANHLAVSVSLVHKTISEYKKTGAKSIESVGKGGRKNSYLTIDEEREFINTFVQQAQLGQIATTAVIKEAFEEKIGEKVHKTTIYRLLSRHQWRKIVPLPFHPKQDKKVQEDFKKTLEKK
jgi:transposase